MARRRLRDSKAEIVKRRSRGQNRDGDDEMETKMARRGRRLRDVIEDGKTERAR